ncbi:MFS transporter [Streptomyces capparidis]
MPAFENDRSNKRRGDGPRPVPSTGPGFAVLAAVQVTLILTLAAISVPLPRIGEEFGLDHSGLVLLTSAYGLPFAGLLLLGGRLADRYGGRRMFTAGLALFAVASAAVPLAPTFAALTGLRFAQGAAAALTAPAAMAVLRVLLPGPAAHARAMATWGGLSVLGATGGSLLSGVVSTYTSWRWIFAVPVAVSAAALACAPRWLPADPERTRVPTLDLPGAALATAGVTLTGYGLIATDAHGWGAGSALVPLLSGAALLAAFVLLERRTREPLLPPAFLRHPSRALGTAAVALTAAGTALVFFLLPLGFQQERGWSPLRTSAAFVPYTAVLLAAGRAAGPLIARFGARAVLAAGLAAGAAGMLTLAAFDGDRYLPGPAAGLLLLPAGAALAFAGSAVLAVEGVPARQAGLAGGVMNTAMEAGPTVGLAILLSLGGPAAALTAAGACFAATAALTALAAGARPPRGPRGPRPAARPAAAPTTTVP